jgi:hypothetical protein
MKLYTQKVTCCRCPNRIEMKFLYNPYTMISKWPGNMEDYRDRYVCMKTKDKDGSPKEIKFDYKLCAPDWCELEDVPPYKYESEDVQY